ncbi:MAG: helix-hairpin-helix domain-containing protein [Candidatus Omnitrophica bacterium]|nr:helix-hairpin-helix domain-containing protein [Candidatus Omnitrophota bacterium]
MANHKEAKGEKTQHAYDNLYNLREEKEIAIGKGKLTYVLVDEESKINMNSASQNIIERLLQNTSDLSDAASQKLAESIIAYRSKQPLRVKEELLNIEDFEEKVFDSCKNSITIYGNGKVNINTAGTEALKALGLSDSLAKTIIEFRNGPDNKEATKDDNFFENTSEVISKLNSFSSLSTEEELLLASLVGNSTIDVKSSSFTIKADGKILDNSTMKYEITLDDKGKIRNWIEY